MEKVGDSADKTKDDSTDEKEGDSADEGADHGKYGEDNGKGRVYALGLLAGP